MRISDWSSDVCSSDFRRRGDLLSKRDAHAVAGSWNLLFSFLLAFTGSFFSFATSFGVPVMAMVAFNGDQAKAFETFIGNPPVNDPRPAPMASIEAMLADATHRAGADTFFISVEHRSEEHTSELKSLMRI